MPLLAYLSPDLLMYAGCDARQVDCSGHTAQLSPRPAPKQLTWIYRAAFRDTVHHTLVALSNQQTGAVCDSRVGAGVLGEVGDHLDPSLTQMGVQTVDGAAAAGE